MNARLRGLLFTSYGQPRLFVPGLAMLVVAFLVALVAIRLGLRPRTDEEQAAALLRSGKAAQAELVYKRLLLEEPTVPRVMALLEAHEHATIAQKVADALSDRRERGGSMGLSDPDAPLAEEEVDSIIASLPEDVRLIARFVRRAPSGAVPDDVRAPIEEGAKREPPMPFANHVLAREAVRAGKHALAADLYLREGVSFPERASDVDAGLAILIALDDWDDVEDRMSDPRVSAAASPMIGYRIAVRRGDWVSAAKILPRAWRPRLRGPGLAMTAVAALAWAFFCARLGKLGSRPKLRLPLYVTAFALGVLSIAPTVMLIAIEEAKLRLVETGDAARDVLFFVFGVGLREEASKLLLFAPLLPVLRRYGDKLDVLVCGAMVGLGFAAEENLGYLAREDLHTGLARFLTANFLHMAMTGILASALDDFVADREKNAPAFTRATLTVVALHGAYDFLLSHPEYGGAYLAMTVFVVLTRMFLSAVDVARRRADRGIAPVHAFILAVAVVTGVSLAHAFVTVGPAYAALVMGEGLLGLAIIVFVFVRTLRSM